MSSFPPLLPSSELLVSDLHSFRDQDEFAQQSWQAPRPLQSGVRPMATSMNCSTTYHSLCMIEHKFVGDVFFEGERIQNLEESTIWAIQAARDWFKLEIAWTCSLLFSKDQHQRYLVVLSKSLWTRSPSSIAIATSVAFNLEVTRMEPLRVGKRCMFGNPFVSTRDSIAWLPSPPFEDSDVLVLSSRSTAPGGVGNTLFYLDLRLSLPLGPASEVNWGFAGLRRTLSTSPLRLRWAHNVIDSRGDGLADEGEMVQRDGLDVETGIGLNPATGQLGPYEEVWRDEVLPAGSPFIFVSSSANVEESTAVMAVLGPHALALAQEADNLDVTRKFRAVRMRKTAAQDTDEPVWELVFSSGSLAQERELKGLIELADQASLYARGHTVSIEGRSWVIWDAGRVTMA